MDNLKRRLSNFALEYLLNAVLPERVLEVKEIAPNQKQVYLGGEILSDSALNNLVAEAKWWESSNLNEILIETLKRDAEKRMFEKSMTIQDMLAGKMLLYSIDVQRKLIAFLAKL